MSTSEHRIVEADILAPEIYARERETRRRALIPVKRNRRIEVGPFATFYFENFDTMLLQVQEMLHIEKGGDPQLEDELAAYNPLIPQGGELVATVMFEIDDPVRRAATLARLGGVEHHIFLDVAGERNRGEPDPRRENTSPDGKASSVQFIRFSFTEKQVRLFKATGAQIIAGCDHPNYGHMAVLPEPMRIALSEDFD